MGTRAALGQKSTNVRGHSLTFPKDCRVRLLVAKANQRSDLFVTLMIIV